MFAVFFNFPNKLKLAFLLLVILLIGITKSLVYRNQASDLGQLFTSVYKDRLLAESYLYRINNLVLNQTKSKSQVIPNRQVDLLKSNSELNQWIEKYEDTKLTKPEANLLQTLHKQLAVFSSFSLDTTRLENSKLKLAELSGNIQNTIISLVDIQTSEGQVLNEKSKKLLASFALISEFELVMYIIIGVLIQALILTSAPIKHHLLNKATLN